MSELGPMDPTRNKGELKSLVHCRLHKRDLRKQLPNEVKSGVIYPGTKEKKGRRTAKQAKKICSCILVCLNGGSKKVKGGG